MSLKTRIRAHSSVTVWSLGPHCLNCKNRVTPAQLISQVALQALWLEHLAPRGSCLVQKK